MTNQKQRELHIASGRYEVLLAQTVEEVEAAQSLRYKVFNEELGEGLKASQKYHLDVDKYDEQCDHLLVIDRRNDKVIGTYRLQCYSYAQKYHGYYTEDEFDLSLLLGSILTNSVEVGRACIDREHRNGRVLYFLWRGIAKYIQKFQARYLLGCCSLNSTDPKEGWMLKAYLQRKGYFHPEFSVEAKPNYHCPKIPIEKNTRQKLTPPKLFQLYLDLGAKVLSNPALDLSFKTIDFLILVDIQELGEDSRALFFQ